MADEYTQTDETVRTTFVEGASEAYYAMSWYEPFADSYDRWLAAHDARVRRDAAREALDGLADEYTYDVPVPRIAHYRDTHYPEETP